MSIKRRKRNPDGSLGNVESVTGLPNINADLLVAFEAIAMQSEQMAAQQEEIEALKTEVETLKGSGV